MPDEVGIWTYSCSFSDGQPGKSGSFVCTSANAKPGPLRTDPNNKRWFKHANGDHFYLRGYYLSEVFTTGSSLSDNTQWKADVNKGFGPNSQYNFNFVCTIFWQGPALKSHNWNARPFNGFYPCINKVTVLDIAAWKHVDEVLQYLESKGTIWYNFDGFIINPQCGGHRPGNATEETVMIRNWVARLAPYWNIVWNIAFEWAEWMSATEVNRIGNQIKAMDPWDHPRTVHNHSVSTLPSGSGAWHTFYSVQHNMGRAGTAALGNAAADEGGYTTKPLYAQEVIWQGGDKLNDTQTRRGGWGVMVGAGYLNYAEQFDNVYYNNGGFTYIKIMMDFMESTLYWNMSRNNSLTNKGYCLADQGNEYVVYIESGANSGVTVNTSAASGKKTVSRLHKRFLKSYSQCALVRGGPAHRRRTARCHSPICSFRTGRTGNQRIAD
jgi:hypothetical protein